MADVEQYEGGVAYVNSGDIFEDSKRIIDSAQSAARNAVNVTLVARNWFLGKRIAEEELQGHSRADYGREIIKSLSERLTKQYRRGFESSNLYWFLRFYRGYPNIFDFGNQKSRRLLSWTHYRELLKVEDAVVREWYEQESVREVWTAKTLRRNIASQYYHRLLKSQMKQPVIDEMRELTSHL